MGRSKGLLGGLALWALVCGTAEGQQPWRFSTYYGGRGTESSIKVGVDAAGNTYLSGTTSSIDAPFDDRGQLLSLPRVFLVKMDAGGQVLFSRILAGSLGAMAVDSEGNTYLTGSTGTDIGFQPTQGSFQTAVSGRGGFVMKVDTEGNTVFATLLGNRGSVRISAIGFDGERNVAVCGSGRAGDVPLTEDAMQKETDPQTVLAGFCSVLSADGSNLRYSTLVGGSGTADVSTLLVEDSGDLVVGGTTSSSDLPGSEPAGREDPRRVLFRIGSGEETWSAIGGGELGAVRSIAFGSTPSNVFLSTDRGLQVSEDGGESWQRKPAVGGVLAVHPADPRYMCIVTSVQSLTCSIDGGSEWRRLSLFGALRVVADPKQEGSFYVAATDGVVQITLSSDGVLRPGRQLFSGPLTGMAIDSSGVNTVIWVASSGSVFRSTDGSPRFERLGSNISKIFAVPQSPGVLYGTRAARLTPTSPWLAQSEDGGATWTDIPSNLGPRSSLDLVPDPTSPGTLFAISDGVYRSRDGGRTWAQIQSGMGNGSVLALQVDDSGKIWAGASLNPNAFVTRLKISEKTAGFATLFGGSGGGTVSALTRDASGRIVVHGWSWSSDLPVTEIPIQTPSTSYGQYYLGVLDDGGAMTKLRWTGWLSTAMAADGYGRILLAGTSREFRSSLGGVTISGRYGGQTEGLWAVVDVETGLVTHAEWVGGSSDEEITAIAIGPDGLVRLAGVTSSDDFPAFGGVQVTRSGQGDGFLVVTPVPGTP